MLVAEKCLLIGVRDWLRTHAEYTETQCEVEFDGMAPATAGATYVAVLPGGWNPGKRHSTSGGIRDFVYGVDVEIVKRISHTPRDRRRSVFLTNLSSINAEIDKIIPLIDWNYGLMNAVNGLMQAETGENHNFIEPLQFVSVERRPRIVGAEYFAGAPDDAVALARTISFHRARRIVEQ